MSAITPQTELKLLKCPIESDNRNQMTFSNATAQYNYFNSLPKLSVDNFTYQRKDNIIRYPAHIDTILTYNYVMYQNEAYTNKWFYAFITKMEYVNDNMTYISIKTDVYQTWQFDMVWKRSFIEREHVNDDTLGKHTVPENLETGPYKVYSTTYDNVNNQLNLITLSTVGPSDYESYTMGLYNNIPTPGVYCKWKKTQYSDLINFLNGLNSRGKISAMVSMFFAPDWIAPTTGGTIYVDENTSIAPTETVGITRIADLDGYVPVNKKLLTYPFCYIGLSNGMGMYKTYRQERWALNSGEMKVDMRGVLVPSGSIRAFPRDYNGESGRCDDESITIGKFPQVAWSNDLYTNWQTQNGVNIGGIKLTATESAIGGALLKIGVGAAMASSGNIMGAGFVGTGIADIYNSVQQEYQHSLIPNAVEGSVNSGDVSTIIYANRLHIYKMGISNEYAKICDQYLSMYGYKINQVAIPHITGRENWNYVKTIGANIEGNIPEDDLNEIKSIFNNGVTLWHKASTYLDYSQSNPIV